MLVYSSNVKFQDYEIESIYFIKSQVNITTKRGMDSFYFRIKDCGKYKKIKLTNKFFDWYFLNFVDFNKVGSRTFYDIFPGFHALSTRYGHIITNIEL